MATFSFNEDGTLNYLDGKYPQIEDYGINASTHYDIDADRSCSKGCNNVHKWYETRNGIYSFIQALYKKNKIISDSIVLKYLDLIPEEHKHYFLTSVQNVNTIISRRFSNVAGVKSNRSAIASQKKKSKTKSEKKSALKKARKEAAQTNQTKVAKQLEEINRKTTELMLDTVRLVQDTGASAQIGNFKISKLK